eukprot:1158048-Pelagomonas_calceolata.AAC.10
MIVSEFSWWEALDSPDKSDTKEAICSLARATANVLPAVTLGGKGAAKNQQPNEMYSSNQRATCTLGQERPFPPSLVADFLQTLEHCMFAWPMQLSAWAITASVVVPPKRSASAEALQQIRLSKRRRSQDGKAAKDLIIIICYMFGRPNHAGISASTQMKGRTWQHPAFQKISPIHFLSGFLRTSLCLQPLATLPWAPLTLFIISCQYHHFLLLLPSLLSFSILLLHVPVPAAYSHSALDSAHPFCPKRGIHCSPASWSPNKSMLGRLDHQTW